MGTTFGSDIEVERWAADEVRESYFSWRDECVAVRLAYQQWVEATTRADGWLAHAAYRAALDREEETACVYASHVARVRRITD